MTKKTPTVHNPTNFNPADYEVVDYLDNKRPAFFGQPAEAYAEELKFWAAELEALLGPDWRAKKDSCIHCGKNGIRWITATKHFPTGETVVFGADCTARLGFTDQKTFKLAQLKRRADARNASLKVYNAVERFLGERPALAAARLTLDAPEHKANSFAQDIFTKLAKYGSISEKQESAVLASLARDLTRVTELAARDAEAKVPAPEGRIVITGTVISLKDHEGQYGFSTKATIKVVTPQGVWLAWGTKPGGAKWERGQEVTFTGTVTRSDRDPHFAFYKRPTACPGGAARRRHPAPFRRVTMVQCPRCFGRGYIPEPRTPSKRNPAGIGFYARSCPRCQGSGQIVEKAKVAR